MRILLSSALAIMALATIAYVEQAGRSVVPDAAEQSAGAAEASPATSQRNVPLTPRDARQVRSFEALVVLTTLNAEPKKQWPPR